MSTSKDRLIEFLSYLKMGQNAFEKKVGISNGYISRSKGSFGSKIVTNISKVYPELSTLWLITGEGSMLKNTATPYSINQEQKGTPYYDVDFIGGFDLVENDQTQNPTYHIYFPQYDKADCWVNITGHSMEPLISHGDIVALKKLEDWHTYVLYGETYAIVTDEYRTVKKVRKSTKGDDFIRLVPANIEFDEQDVNKSIIRRVYQVLGCAKKIF